MACFNGKWKLVSSENGAKFAESIGTDAAWVAARKDMEDPSKDIVEELIVTDTETKVVVYLAGTERSRWSMAVGKEIDQAGLDGRMAKMKVVVEGNKLTRTRTGDGYSATYVRTVDGNTMTQEMTSSAGVTAKRVFQKI